MSTQHVEESEARRAEIDELISVGDATAAQGLMPQLWRQNPGLALANFILSRFEKLLPSLGVVSRRVAVLRSFTVEPIIPLLRAGAAVNGIELTVYLSDFNAYAQEMLDQSSNLYRFEPDIVILAAQTRDLAPELWDDFPDLSPSEVTAAISRITGDLQSWVQAFRSRSQAHLVLHTLEMPFIPSNGVWDAQSETGQLEAIRSINSEQRRLAQEHTGVYVLEYDALIARHGWSSWHDERKWLTMRMPIAADHLIHLANEWLRFIHPLTGKVCKVLVTDLDNTLWGGVIGEDGMNGIKLGPEYPSAAYQALQRAILDLHRRGIILAVCSKNNLSDGMEVLERHPGMLLRPQHFAAIRINWNDKAQNLREIATELNLGTDALAFLDDNPAERQFVRNQLPEVAVIDLPDDPIRYAGALRDSPVFERLSLSAEDRDRPQYYAEERLRTNLQQSSASLEDFYRSLQMVVEISLVNPETLGRVAQLTQKTNQFNLTTRRYSEQQIAEMAAAPDYRVYSVRMRDRFGDSGLVGVAITRYQERICEIDTFLLSCRVISRTVETAMLATIAEQAQKESAQRLVGWFLLTKKNAPAREFYPSHGFISTLKGDAESRWEFEMGATKIVAPPWIRRIVMVGEELNV